MFNSFTFACGQGATKALIHCVETGVVSYNNCCIVNSTIKDVPSKYEDKAIIISDDPDAGCGKVRGAARSLMVRYLKNNPNVIDSMLEETDYVNIITTTEGASGSGASVVLAHFIKNDLGIPVIITVITGFETDIRGIQNTIEYFKDLNGGDFVINTVSNKKFLDSYGNTFAAEKAANEYIANTINMINENKIINSEQNIDDTDHYKIITNPGLLFCNESTFEKIKNKSQFDQIVSDLVDYSKSLDFSPSATKIGIYMNISDSNLDNVDTNFTSLKKKLCENDCVPELFIHKQYDKNEKEFVRIIASGINLPKEELEAMYNKFQNSMKNAHMKDDFFSSISNMDTSSNTESSSNRTSNSFLNQFEDSAGNEEEEVVLGRNRRSRRRHSTMSNNINSDNNTADEKKVNKFTTSNKKVPYSEDSIDNY